MQWALNGHTALSPLANTNRHLCPKWLAACWGQRAPKAHATSRSSKEKCLCSLLVFFVFKQSIYWLFVYKYEIQSFQEVDSGMEEHRETSPNRLRGLSTSCWEQVKSGQCPRERGLQADKRSSMEDRPCWAQRGSQQDKEASNRGCKAAK